MFVSDIKDRSQVDAVFLVREKITAMAKNGKAAGKSKKDGKLAVVLDELSTEDNAISESSSDDSSSEDMVA